jgi:Asp/Glu/hydantoin racemase
MSKRQRIILLHATPVAMAPIEAAFERNWAEAEIINLLDDGLSIDRAEQEGLSVDLIERFLVFGRYAHRTGADGVLATCSAFGPALDLLASELPVPVLKPNEAMFRAAIARGRRIGMLATFLPAVATMSDEFDAFVAETGSSASLDVIVVDDAIQCLRAGDADSHNRLIAEEASKFKDHDAIMLAHFSTARATDLVQKAVDIPVLAAPDSAVLRMKDLIESKEH